MNIKNGVDFFNFIQLLINKNLFTAAKQMLIDSDFNIFLTTDQQILKQNYLQNVVKIELLCS